jgi:hypothetical protein
VTRVDVIVIRGTALSSVNPVRAKNISSIDLHCLTDKTSEVYSPVKPLKEEETIVSLTIERPNPDLTLSSMLSSSPSKIKGT